MICTFFSPAEHVEAMASNKRHRMTSCGRTTPFMRLEIMDDDGNILPAGEIGEIVIRGANVTPGYENLTPYNFDLEKAKTLFVMFQRQHHSMDYEGIGMGLALAQRIVDRHQGRIWCETAPGQGCTFFIELPPAGTDIDLP